MRVPTRSITASLAAILLVLLLVHPVAIGRRSTGLEVKIARVIPCPTDPLPGELLQLLQPGLVRMGSEDLTLGELDRRLETVFSRRSVRLVFVAGGAGHPFREVAKILEIASKHADHVALVTPTVQGGIKPRLGQCLDPDINLSPTLM
jgi:hypothetical protein